MASSGNATAEQAMCRGRWMLVFRKKGINNIPISHPRGMLTYAGKSSPPSEVHRYRDWKGKQTENRFSHWIWRQYASCVWDDIRLGNVLPYKIARDPEDEKHLHPLQLDVIERVIALRSNPGETVLTPFMGVGSEAFIALRMERKAIGIELKKSYYSQALKNIADVEVGSISQQEMEL